MGSEEITHYLLCAPLSPWSEASVDKQAVTHFFCASTLSAQEALFVIIHQPLPCPQHPDLISTPSSPTHTHRYTHITLSVRAFTDYINYLTFNLYSH